MTTSDCNCPVDDSWVKVYLFPSLYFVFFIRGSPFALFCCCCLSPYHYRVHMSPPGGGQSTETTTSQQLNMPPFVVIHLSGPTPLLRLSILIILNAFTLLVIPTTKTRHWPPKSNHSRVTLSGGKSYIIISRVQWCLCPKWRRFGFNLSSDWINTIKFVSDMLSTVVDIIPLSQVILNQADHDHGDMI